ncbi:MAG: translocation/assembly module TamB domain-containing protein [Nonlabens sp.]|uniref:translocation/assembly module TamB domain-containing protein n=1 Tax=Nonlabens sp. TaxID=1888209 RepID=UPI003EF55A27
MAEKEEQHQPQKRGTKFRWLRRIARVMLGILIFLILLLLFIRSPWGQSIIVDYAVSYVQDKTGTEVQLKKAFITFDGDVKLEGLYLADTQNDTLIYSKSLEANIALMPLINGTGFEIDDVEWDGFTARIKREDSISGFNYKFLVDAFATAPDTTTSAPMDIKIGDIQLTNFDIVYQDQVDEMDASATFDDLFLEMNAIDLDKMIVDVEEFTLKNAVINYEKDVVTAFAKAEPDKNPNKDTNLAEAITDSADDSPLPFLKAGKIRLDNVVLNYNSEPDGIVIKTNLKVLETVIPKADIQNNDMEVSYFTLDNSKIEVNMMDSNAVTTDVAAESTVFEWPDMNVALHQLNFNNNHFVYTLNGEQPSRKELNPNAISLSNIDIDLQDFKLGNQQAAVQINELKLKEYSGLRLNNLKGNISVTNSQIDVNQLLASVNNSSLNGAIQLRYSSIDALINNPETLKVQANIPQYNFVLSDLYAFQPDLAQNEYVAKLAQQPLRGTTKTSGSTANLNLDSFILNWGNNTSITASGQLKNVTDVDQLYFNLPKINAVTTRNTILNFIKEEDLGITLPENARLQASASGTLENVKTNAKLLTSYGALAVNGSFKNAASIQFDARVKLDTLNLSKMLTMQGIGDLSLELNAKGSGSDLKSLNATIDGTINKFSYNEYPLEGIPINGSMKNGVGALNSKFKDDNINIVLDATANLASELTKASATIDVVGVDLRAFGITSQNVKAAGKIGVTYEGDASNYKIKSNIDDGIAVFDNQSYLLGNLTVDAFVQPDSTSLDIHNKMLDLELRSNTDPENLAGALQRHIDRYLTTSKAMDTTRPVVMKIKGNVSPAPILRDVILPGLQALDTINIAVDFNEKDRKLDSDISVAYLKYADSEVDSLVISSRSDADNLKFQLGFKNIIAGPVNIQRTAMTGTVAGNILNLDFTSYDDEERLIHFASTLSRKRDEQGIEDLIFNLSLEDLILNKQPWTIPANNQIAVRENRIRFTDFKLTNGVQSLELRADRPNTDKDHIALLIDNFRLQGFLSFLNADDKLATGEVNGEFIVDDIYGATGFLADLEIKDFHAMETPLGTLKLDAKTLDDSRYDMTLSVKGDDVDLVLDGDYEANEVAALLNLDLDINKISMSTLAGLSDGFLKDGNGSLNGNFKVTGTTLEPKYDGALRFDNASVNVSMLDTSFTLKNEEIKVDNAGIYMNQLAIIDANGNPFTIDGKVGTEDIFTPTFDLKLKAKNFTALNSTEKDNELYYGKATFDAQARITGNLDIPVIDLEVTVKDVTDVTYVVPATELDIVQRDGIVQFVNKENPDAILTQTEEESATLTGFDVTANIKVKKDATVHIILDPATNSELQVQGNGDLKFRMTPNGRMTLTGRYEIADGFYKLDLYEIVSRKFDLVKGGSVTWSGDPFDATLDVRALYKVETSASALMASQTSGADISTKNRFRQKLPFLVYLNVDGELMQPEISFKIDMPEDEQGAVGGQVFGRLQQLNSQDQELNKQVFSLLVLNKFFPTSGADGSDGGTATIARDNLNQALSDQLNQFGGKLLGNSGIDLNFGLDSFTDYQGANPQERTQLDVTASKKLLDDRLIVSVGSEIDVQGSAQDGQQTPVIGNVSLEYLLTQAGQWRLRGFRRNQYDNVVDGQLIVSGISLIFTKEFNEFKSLFAKTVQEEVDKQKKNQNENQNQEEEEIEQDQKQNKK